MQCCKASRIAFYAYVFYLRLAQKYRLLPLNARTSPAYTT
jgi:hypothetical protein